MHKNILFKSVPTLRFHILFITVTLCLSGNLPGWEPEAYAKSLAQETDDTTIIYISEDARSLHLIQPDGSNDRLLWHVPDNVPGGPIDSVMWRPDAQQIAFTSTHEATCSEYAADIYLINPDGSNLQRLTNGPGCDQLAGYPQGSATVQISNQNSNFSEYLVYIEGAPTAKVVTVAPGGTAMVAFPQVADLGEGVLQLAVATNGTTRWFDASMAVDVIANENAHAGTLTVTGGGFAAYGATHVSWSPDGSRLAYQLGQGRLWQVGIDAPPLSEGGPLLNASINNSVFGTYPVWSPVGNELLYQQMNGSRFVITRAQVDGDNAGQNLANVTDTSGIAWLSDGSGMIVSAYSDLLLTHVDLYLLTFTNNNIVQVTQTSGQQAAFLPSVSPDSSQIVYGYTEDITEKPFNSELRIMNMDGSDDHLLVANARRASWSRVAPQNSAVTPTATATTQPTATATPKPGATATPPTGSNSESVYLPLVTR